MERLHTTPARDIATYRCPRCRRQIRALADEYGDHGCICGWVNDEVTPDESVVDEIETEDDEE